MPGINYLLAKLIDIDAGSQGIPEAAINQDQFAKIFGGVLLLIGALAVVFIVAGGIRYSISQGSPAETKRAKETIIYSLVGLVIVIFSFGIVQLFTGRIF